jgi:hypothetical protein
MRRIAKFENKQLAPGAEITTELEGGNVLNTLTWRAAGTAAASGTGTVACDGPYNWLGRITAKVGTRTIVDLLGSDWRHLSSFIAGGYGEVGPAALATGDQILTAHGHLPFNKLIPRAYVNGRDQKVTVQTRFGAVADLGTSVTGVTGDFDVHGYTTDDFDPQYLWFEPHFRTVEIVLTPSTRLGHAINFADDEIVMFVMFRQLDASLQLTQPNDSRPDNLVRRVTIERQKAGRARETLVPELGWSQLKQKGVYEYGLKAVTGQLHRGVALYSFDDPHTDKLETAFFGRGDQLHISVNTTATMEADLIAANALETGVDKVYVTLVGFRPMGREYEADRRGALLKNGIRPF